MSASVHRRLNRRKRRILRRLENKPGIERPEPMMATCGGVVVLGSFWCRRWRMGAAA